MRRAVVLGVVVIVAAIIGGFSLNYALVGRPVATALAADERNSSFTIRAHYRYYLDPHSVVLDLTEATVIAPTDLFRAIFQSAQALKDHAGIERVFLIRNRKVIFVMKGEDFREIGTEYGGGQNPVYLIRTLPEKLYLPTGESAFSHWSGGLFAVLAKQMEDANAAARLWAGADDTAAVLDAAAEAK
jgi:hypothetical protein